MTVGEFACNMAMPYTPPSHDCPICPRLAVFRSENRKEYPDFFNAPVPSFGDLSARLLVVGLAPGLKGANRTGRPFTGDYAGLVLYSSLKKYGFTEGEYDPEKVSGFWLQVSAPAPDTQHLTPHTDGFHLLDCRITNAVRCVPQENKPETREIRQCNGFLAAEIKAMPNLKVILTLGQIAHKAVLMALGYKQSAFAFGHGREHIIGQPRAFLSLRERLGEGKHGMSSPLAPHPNPLPEGEGISSAGEKIHLINSYHCSRYNINTGALTQEMFDKIISNARRALN